MGVDAGIECDNGRQWHLRRAATAAARGSGTPHDDEEYEETNCSNMHVQSVTKKRRRGQKTHSGILRLTWRVWGTESAAHATVNTPPPCISGVLVSAMVMVVLIGREQEERGGDVISAHA
jgi:hypothetical protein